ncbi:ASCH domain-containing protein [Candidatus Pacearchaeota archaeon]|nr:ASCH domain-containing protein [Candidatus Pacearchaeota archaeon]
MKALSLKQPFAELVVSGKKTIELRKWNTRFRGEFLIHASQNVDQEAMEKFGFDTLPTGCIVGKATLVDVKKYNNDKEFENDKDKHCASKEWGLHGFVLENAGRIPPVYCKGKLNFWNYN